MPNDQRTQAAPQARPAGAERGDGAPASDGDRGSGGTKSPSQAIETHGLRKEFGEFVAVDGIDLLVPRGSFYGFLGPNGAGKSTTIKCLTGLLRPTAGTFRILDMDPIADPVAVKRQVGVVPEDLALFDRLSGAETLAFVGQVHGLDSKSIRARSQELLTLMDLTKSANELVADYSHGMRKKIALSAALLPAPRLLFLDEPFEGIDAIASRQIKDLLAAFVKNGGTVFLTTHVLEIVERLCDYIGIINKGRMVAAGPMAELRAGGVQGQSLEERFMEIVGASKSTLPTLDWLG